MSQTGTEHDIQTSVALIRNTTHLTLTLDWTGGYYLSYATYYSCYPPGLPTNTSIGASNRGYPTLSPHSAVCSLELPSPTSTSAAAVTS
jgi:hypothetical protein